MKVVAQLTGALVTAIIVVGTNLDLRTSVPLGMLAGALAIFFVSLSQAQAAYRAKWRDY